ncbi:TMhelix containing protein [Vibrio phage 1.210.O._10N.222.52.C2]|nr:TMhelix containing protein [Vibrio phage 1.210.O._10N.222.52.C2]
MKFNKEFFKRWSTLANMIAMVCAGVISSIPSLDISASTVGVLMLTMNVIISICQAIKQEAKNV